MTEQEAIEMLEHSIVSYETQNRNNITCDLTQEVLDMAISALEKQIPKKPTDQSKVRDCEGYVGLIGKCPCCGEILEEDTVYCDCGQKLDWGD